MTTYSEITNGQVDAESVVDTTLAGQWTNNLLAVIEGDPTASGARIAGDLAMTEIVDGTTRRHFQALTGVHETYDATGFEFVSRSEWVVPRSGIYTLNFDLLDTHLTVDAPSNQGNVQARFYKNAAPAYSGDAATGITHSEGNGNWTTFSDTGISLNAGDVVSIYVNNNTGPRVSIRNIIWSSGTKLFG